ncbi:putative soluble quinone reductase [Mesorhizobium alhagi CCNWXJ12-2]|uniref:Putative soluble quinone reductase n=1 Tax=Mesorhizobium alhagi CCNWXJ12-2 TaxID=1107882 RepID=H0HNX9_9HYPH|nr:putative soluble quinone reductase [Mesorhizobium alhagi CCNWXJ12-2]
MTVVTYQTKPTSNQPVVRVLGLTGSLRSQSVNRALMSAAHELKPDDMQIMDHAGLDQLPYFNEDVETEGDPTTVQALKSALHSVDALLIVTPEYNSGVPAVLKNAIDWASRGASLLKEMPVALMSASPSPMGGQRAQLQFRQTLTGIGAHVLPAPDILIGSAPQRFDADLRLSDEPTRKLVARHLVRLRDWTLALGALRLHLKEAA